MLFFQLLEFLASRIPNCLLQRQALLVDLAHPCLQVLPPLLRPGVNIVRTFGPIDRRKDRLQIVVMLLCEGIKLVIVTASTLDGDTTEGVKRVGHHLVPVDVPGNPAIDLRLGNFHVTDEIPGTGRDESKSQDAIRVTRKKHVPCQLFLDETPVGLVLVPATNHVVPVGPGIGPQLVLVISARISVLDHVQPVPGPAFAISG